MQYYPLKIKGKTVHLNLRKRHKIYIYTMYKYNISIKFTKMSIYYMDILWLRYGYPVV